MPYWNARQPTLASDAFHILVGLAVPAIVLLELRPILRAVVWLAAA